MKNNQDESKFKTIKEWELETGIKVVEPKGFWGKRNQIYSKKFSRNTFRKAIKISVIKIKTQKGLEFLYE